MQERKELTEGQREFWMRVVWGPKETDCVGHTKEDEIQWRTANLWHLINDLRRVENEKWVTAFKAYSKALSEPYFDQDDESRASNRAEVQRTFDALKALAEE